MTTTPVLVARILNDVPDSTLLADLRPILDKPGTATTIVTLMLSRLPSTGVAIEAVRMAMERMEAIAESDAEVGCSLMAHLWGVASQIDGAFDVCDSIDLWIENTKTPIVETQLRYLAEFPSDPGIREHFRSMTTT